MTNMDYQFDLSVLNEQIKKSEEFSIKTSNLIRGVKEKNITLVSIIESIQEVLTNADVEVRRRGVDFLSWVLTEIPPDLLNPKEIAAVVNFYSDRLNDHHSIAPTTIKGLLALVKMLNISKESIQQFLVPFFQEVNCQTQQQPDRYNIFSIIGCIVENHLDCVATMGFDFVFGIISLADGETDPSNLLLLFKFLPHFLKNFELGHLLEEMFNLLSCYFPIDYNGGGKNLDITRDDLSEGLINCLSARSDFSDHCLPLICEKLQSTYKTAKIDSYKLLTACCLTYSVESLDRFCNELWKFIQKDVLPVIDNDICEAALSSLSEMVKLFSSAEDKSMLKKFLDDILTSIQTLLNKVEDSLFQPALNILLAVSRKSLPAAKYVMNHIQVAFTSNTFKSISERRIILHSLTPFLSILKEVREADFDETKDLIVLNEISMLFIDSMITEDSEVKILALNGIEIIAPVLDGYIMNQLYINLVKCITSKHNIEVRTKCLEVLRALGEIAPNDVRRLLETNFQMNLSSSSDLTDLKLFVAVIGAVAEVINITHYSLPLLIDLITNTEYYEIGFSNLLSACLRSDCKNGEFLKIAHKDYGLTEKLVLWWIEGNVVNKVRSRSSLKDLSEIIALIVRQQETCVQQSIADTLVPVLLRGLDINKDVGNFEPFAVNQSHVFEKNVILLEAILGSIRGSVRLDKFSSIYKTLMVVALESNDEWVQTSSSRLLASFLNKMFDMASMLPEEIWNTILVCFNESSPIGNKLNAANLLTWVVKGLLLANSQHLEYFINKWFDLLNRDDVGMRIAEGFITVLQEEPLYLNIKSHCNIKVLYRQRLFTHFQKLMNSFHQSKETNRDNYLLALNYLIDGVPQHIYMSEIVNVICIATLALDSDKVIVVELVLRILCNILQSKGHALVDQVQNFIPKFLKLAQFKGYMKIRICALKCLYYYAFYPTVSMLPVKNEVVRGLEPCLDDKKRIVRNEAVKARNRWFLVGAPGEDSIFS